MKDLTVYTMTNAIADPVRKCLRALEAAQTDTEKFATLFLVPKLVKGVDCDKNARLHLMKVNYYFNRTYEQRYNSHFFIYLRSKTKIIFNISGNWISVSCSHAP